MSASTAELMTLAGIAYGDPAAIPGYLARDPLTAGDWTVAWIAAPPDPPVNFAYLARSTATGACVLAIRGTYPNPFSPAYWEDGDEDSPFGDMVSWPGAPEARVSAGTAKGLATLQGLTDAVGTTLAAAVGALPPQAALTVTGHSLGGTLAPVVALWLSGEGLAGRLPPRPVSACSFAGMTPGNTAFAALFGPGTALDGRVTRCFNTLDTVAYGWDRVLATHDFYEPSPKGGAVVAAMLLATAARLALGGYDYAPVGTPLSLTGTVRPPTIGCDLVAYVFENLHQHLPDTYLTLLGAPLLPFALGFGSVVLPRDHPQAERGPTPRWPTYHLA
ncbi:lipase [Methylobacterium sp. Leaf466]|uniref:lipase family protein n=1 Tax=Methylobacterium sp. Leaf466 TaxID=1736386 RepID=UPI00070239C9|nr:lipase [Methylobacterium sp. Leaf466]KQT86914.1 lipase [Methylobacterium sp. Leaf466]